MKIRMIALIAGLFAAGCVQISLYPLYTPEDLVFDAALLGEWSEQDSEETWNFSKGEAKGYDLLFVDEEGKKGDFVAHLVKIRKKLFLDIFPKSKDTNESDVYDWHVMRFHSFIRIKQIQPTLQMSIFNSDWVKEYLQQHPDDIQHEKIGDRIVLTAKPKELQDFIMRHENTKEAFEDPFTMTRKDKDRSE
ncbi:MAG: hypothetical protein P8Z37_10040 [Acidobacteriota bacterium]